MTAEVLKAGPMTLIQDLGRTNVAHLGLAQGGALDEHSYLWGNKLLNNKNHHAQIEVNIGPIELRFNQQSVIAITGANMTALLNDHRIDNWSSHRVNAGDILKLRGAKQGVRAYIAIKGGWQLPKVFGSRSSVPRENIGHFVKSGMTLPYLSFKPNQKSIMHSVPRRFQALYSQNNSNSPCLLNLIPGYQFEQFSSSAINNLTQSVFQLSKQCDRMGFRLQGHAISSPQSAFQSEGIALGSVQIPAYGQPIILHKDRQSIGGYPKVGCIALLDLNKLAQLQPGAYIQFILSDLNTESQKRKAFLHFFGMVD